MRASSEPVSIEIADVAFSDTQGQVFSGSVSYNRPIMRNSDAVITSDCPKLESGNLLHLGPQ